MMNEENFDSLMQKARQEGMLKEENYQWKPESDSYHGGSDYASSGPTTFRMLLEKAQVRDSEFIECCQQVGIIGSFSTCPKCSVSMMSILQQSAFSRLDYKQERCRSYNNRHLADWTTNKKGYLQCYI